MIRVVYFAALATVLASHSAFGQPVSAEMTRKLSNFVLEDAKCFHIEGALNAYSANPNNGMAVAVVASATNFVEGYAATKGMSRQDAMQKMLKFCIRNEQAKFTDFVKH